MQIFENEQNEKLRLVAGSEAKEIPCPICRGWIRKDTRPVCLVECSCTLEQIQASVEERASALEHAMTGMSMEEVDRLLGLEERKKA